MPCSLERRWVICVLKKIIGNSLRLCFCFKMLSSRYGILNIWKIYELECSFQGWRCSIDQLLGTFGWEISWLISRRMPRSSSCGIFCWRKCGKLWVCRRLKSTEGNPNRLILWILFVKSLACRRDFYHKDQHSNEEPFWSEWWSYQLRDFRKVHLILTSFQSQNL